MLKFDFLNYKWPELALLANKAEESLMKDPNECMHKIGYFIEKLINEILIAENIANKSNRLNFINKIKLLEDNELLTQDIANDMNMVRVIRNQAVHSEYSSPSMAEAALKLALNIAKWFMLTYGDRTFEIDKEKKTSAADSFEKKELPISVYKKDKYNDYDLDNLWDKIKSYLRNNKTEFHTVPKDNRQPVWFSAVTEGDVVVIDKAVVNTPSSKLKYSRKLTFKDFQKIYPIYLKRESGQSVSKEATEATVNQVYFFSIIKHILNDNKL